MSNKARPLSRIVPLVIVVSVALCSALGGCGCGCGSSGSTAELSGQAGGNQVEAGGALSITGVIVGAVTGVQQESGKTYMKVRSQGIRLTGVEGRRPSVDSGNREFIVELMRPDEDVEEGRKVRATVIGQKTAEGYTLKATRLTLN